MVRLKLAVWEAAMEGQGPIITDIWWLPAAIADFYAQQPAFAVGWRHKVGDWMRVAADHGVSTFTFATMEPVEPRELGDPPPRVLSQRVVRGLYLTKFSIL